MCWYLFAFLLLCVNCYGSYEKHNFAPEFSNTSDESINDSFYCIDIHKQPSLQHPLLKDHKVQLKPTFKPDWIQQEVVLQTRHSGFENQDNLCPESMVPIPKSKIPKAAPYFHNDHIEPIHQLSRQFPGQHFATLFLSEDQNAYHGAYALINIQNPSVRYNQYSKAQIWIESGSPNELNSIQAGWAVHPRLYGSNETYLTTYWTADGYKTGCYNLMCSGYIQVHRSIIPGVTRFVAYSSPRVRETPYVTPFVIVQDKKTHNWLLYVADKMIGYWPKEIFTHLQTGASLIRYGGNTFVSPDGVSPPMGNGNFADVSLRKSCYFREVKFANSDYKMVDIEQGYIDYFIDASDCYNLRYLGYKAREIGYAFTFGGPGGAHCGL